jgi:hypothetical protein
VESEEARICAALIHASACAGGAICGRCETRKPLCKLDAW